MNFLPIFFIFKWLVNMTKMKNVFKMSFSKLFSRAGASLALKAFIWKHGYFINMSKIWRHPGTGI